MIIELLEGCLISKGIGYTSLDDNSRMNIPVSVEMWPIDASGRRVNPLGVVSMDISDGGSILQVSAYLVGGSVIKFSVSDVEFNDGAIVILRKLMISLFSFLFEVVDSITFPLSY